MEKNGSICIMWTMQLLFKRKDLHEWMFTCVRDDGSRTFSPIRWPEICPHDMIHYAVEKYFHIENGFLGMVNRGVDILDFTKPDRWNILKQMNPMAESMVWIIHGMLAGSHSDAHDALEAWCIVAHEYNISASVTPEDLEKILADCLELWTKWRKLAVGEEMVLIR